MVRNVVLDTNIALDLLVFEDAGCKPLQAALASGELRWIGTEPMRSELDRVLGYPLIVTRLERMARSAQQVLDAFDAQVNAVVAPDAPRAGIPVCEDLDDQMFIDLAAANDAVLVSKDRAVLQLRQRLVAFGVAVVPVWSA